MDISDPFLNQRRFPRREFTTMVAVRQCETHTFESSAQISEGGMLLEVSRALLIGEEIEITFYGPGNNFPPVTGRVVYRLQNGPVTRRIGIRFESPSEDLRRQIRTYVEGGVTRDLPK